MSDKTFEWSLTSLALFALIWIITGIVLTLMGIPWIGIGWSITTGIIALILGGVLLLFFWGKDYMSRE
jgi:hypothetical protein